MELHPSGLWPTARSAARMALAALVVGACGIPGPRTADRRPSSRLLDDEVVVAPTGERFRLPPRWVEWHSRYGNNLHLSRAQLDSVRDATGEWDREYAEVVNAVLPFDRCAAHVGGEGWGRRGVSFADLQARLYVGRFDPDSLRAAVLKRGRAAAERFFRPVEGDTGRVGEWSRTTLRWDAMYYDYGATAHVEFLAQTRGERTAVWVLMYSYLSPRSEERAALLDSFRWGW